MYKKYSGMNPNMYCSSSVIFTWFLCYTDIYGQPIEEDDEMFLAWKQFFVLEKIYVKWHKKLYKKYHIIIRSKYVE